MIILDANLFIYAVNYAVNEDTPLKQEGEVVAGIRIVWAGHGRLFMECPSCFPPAHNATGSVPLPAAP
jgi:hypothetical protein